jgi:hypothetical protein
MIALTPRRFCAALLFLEIGCALVGEYRERQSANEGFLIGDCPYYAATAQSLVRDGDWDLCNQLPGDLADHNGFFALSKDRRVVTKHSTLMPILSIPCYWLFGIKGFLVFNIAQTFLLICGIVVLAGGGVLARWLGLVGYLSTPFLFYTYNYSPDVLGAVLVVWSYVFALRVWEPAAQATERADSLACAAGSRKADSLACAVGSRNVVLTGVVAGRAFWAKVYLVFVLAPLALLILPLGWRKTLLCAGVALIAIAPMLITNAHLFGAPWITGYDRDARITEAGFVMTEHYSRFNQPFFAGIRNLLFDSRIGMLRTAPLWILWPVGVWYALRADRSRKTLLRVIALSSAVLINLFFFATYDEWDASVFGNRFLFPALAIGIALQLPFWEKVFAAKRGHVEPPT